MSRRRVLSHATGVAAAAVVGGGAFGADDVKAAGPVAAKGNIRQSLVYWCYKDHFESVEKMADAAKGLGCGSIELIDPKYWDTLKKFGLSCAIAGSHGFVQGMNNPKFQGKCQEILRQRIDDCAAAGVPNVITFTGMREDIPDDVGLANCVKGYKEIMAHAEEKKVTLCLEMLNSRVDKTMKGHPGYQGDHTDYCIELIKKVGSERLKLLFDIYHVQIMDGDIISRIRQHKEYIGHVHTAGNPGAGSWMTSRKSATRRLCGR